MGWNGSDSGRVARQPPQKNGSHHSSTTNFNLNYRAVFAGLIVIALGGAAVWWFVGGRGQAAQGTERKAQSAHIAEAKPAPAPKTPAQFEKESHPGQVKVRGKWYPEYDDKGGRIWVRSKDVTYHTPIVVTNAVNPRRRTKESFIFKDRADEEIAVLLNSDGMLFLGPYSYGQRFTEDFLRALKTPIVINADDDEDTKLLKQAVIDARNDLKTRYDKGEDIAKIMEDTRRDLQELSMYREDLRRQIIKVAQENDYKGKDVQELVDAANTMLVERGVKPLSAEVLFRRRLNLDVNKVKMKERNSK